MVMRDVMPAFVLTELIALLRQEKMVRPGYHTLQAVIGKALAAERRRLSEIVEKALDRDAKTALQQLLVREETLSELAQVKQDAKNFGYRRMALEREKRSALRPLYRAAKEALPRLDISQQNVGYYASLATYYSIYDLRRLQPEQTHLFLLATPGSDTGNGATTWPTPSTSLGSRSRTQPKWPPSSTGRRRWRPDNERPRA